MTQLPPTIPGEPAENADEVNKEFLDGLNAYFAPPAVEPSDDEGTDGSGDGEGGTQSPATGTTPEPPASTKGEGAAGDGTTPSSPAAPPPLYEPPAPVEPGTETTTYTVKGRQLTAPELEQALAVSDFWSKVPPEQAQNVQQYLDGNATIHPAFGIGQPGLPDPTQHQRTVAAPGLPDPALGILGAPPAADEEPIDLDPRVLAYLQAQAAEIENLKRNTQGLQAVTATSQAQQQWEATMAALDQATTAYKTARGVTDEEAEQLIAATEQFNILPGLIAKYQGDISKALPEAYDMMYWQVPSLRDRAMAAHAATEIQRETQERSRRRVQSGLSGGSSSAPRGRTTPPSPRDKEAAMVAALTSVLSGQGMPAANGQ